jgi:four helix bundle protein
LADAATDGIGPGRGDLVDQLRRASASIALNIAEGSGEFSAKEKARIDRIAKRSATECSAILDLLRRRAARSGNDDLRHFTAGRSLLLRLVSMLVRLIQSIEQRA